MKNRDKYKDELIEAIKMEGMICRFVKKHEIFRMIGKDLESYCKMTCVTCGTALQLWLDEEYEETEVDWDNVPVDTLVRVRDFKSDEWTLRYFKCFSRTPSLYPHEYNYEVWALGATSVTAEWDTERWKYCELVEDKEDENEED